MNDALLQLNFFKSIPDFHGAFQSKAMTKLIGSIVNPAPTLYKVYAVDNKLKYE